jgi:hypothetical protein
MSEQDNESQQEAVEVQSVRSDPADPYEPVNILSQEVA